MLAFLHAAAKGLGVFLAPVVDEPAAGEEIAVEVVEVVAFEGHRDIALVFLAGVVGVLPLLPAVFGVEFLGHVPLAHGRVHGVEEHPRTGGLKADAAPALDLAQADPVVLGRKRREEQGAKRASRQPREHRPRPGRIFSGQ